MRHPKEGEVDIDEYRMIETAACEGNVFRITMDRPEIKNAQNTRMLAELEDAFQAADRNDDMNAIILDGAGTDFSSGHDLAENREDPLDRAWLDEHRSGLEDQMRVERDFFYDHAMRIRDLGTPTIASVQGNCILGGLMLADVCDLIVAGEDAVFSNPAVRMAGTGAEVMTLPWSIGIRKTKELLWTGDPLYAEDAKELGLVNRVVPREDLEDETMYLAKRVALNPSEGLKMTKQSLNYALDQMGQADALEYHFAIHQMGHRTNERADWNEQARARKRDGGFKEWVEYRDGDFKDLAAEYDKSDPHIS